MFSKVLVANRGEIAIRAFRDAYEVGARTVAVFPVAAPFQGVVTTVVAEGDKVSAGDVVATIEAMKMEASITVPVLLLT